VRVDSGVEDGSVVSVHYDPMLAKVIAWAPTRLEAAQRLGAALAAAEVHGVTTNRDLLVRILREPDFLAGRTDTAYLEHHDPAILGAPPTDSATLRVHALAAALAGRAARRAAAPVLRSLPAGWRNNPSALQEVAFDCGEQRISVGYGSDDPLTATVDGEPLAAVHVHDAGAEGVDLEVDGVRRRVRVHAAGGAVHVDSPLGSSVLREVDRLPEPGSSAATGSLRAPMPGSVVRILVEAGDTVAAGQPLLILEAMKMEHTIQAPHDGNVVEVRVAVGDQVEAGAVLAVVESLE
jgi:acetyl/propionyl-CoA carboxylase alpha subunit